LTHISPTSSPIDLITTAAVGATDAESSQAEPAAHEHAPASMVQRVTTLIVVVSPVLGLIAAVILLWGTAFNWVYAALFGVMYLLTGLGITVGFHRLFTHKSFDTPKAVSFALAAFGSMAAQGPVLMWAAHHRKHHRHSDEDHDPHSPHAFGPGVLSVLRGFWHAHVGWMFEGSPRDLPKYVPDLRRDPVLRLNHRLFLVWVLAGLAIPALLGGLLTWSWMGVLLGFLWGGLVRAFFVHHVTWSVNSVCHIWGSRPFRSHDESRNNPIFGVLALGEGWHNNHHAFPASARHGLRWWQFDASYVFIKGLEFVGLASNVRVPTPERLAAKLKG
jgi:stearoyl-CoA desaturase (delta-9 desaturase)